MGIPPRRTACDRCYAIKAKCTGPSHDGSAHSTACERCARLGHQCGKARPALAAGRPRKPENVLREPRAAMEFCWALAFGPIPLASETASSSGPNCLIFESTPPRRGDQRTGAKTNVKPQAGCETPLLLRPSDPLLSRLTPRDETLLSVMFDKAGFINYFVLAPRYADDILGHLFASLSSSPESLLSIFLACAGLFSRKLRLGPCSDASIDYANGARAVRALRGTAEAGAALSRADLMTMITLGLGAVTFELLGSGRCAHSISRYTIGLVDHSFRLANVAPGSTQGTVIPDDLRPSLVPLVALDLFNCVIRRQVPAFKLQLQGQNTVDRYIGLCRPLLPCLFDLCCIGHELSSYHAAAMDTCKVRNDRMSVIEADLCMLESTVLSWHSSLPGDMGLLKAQADIYQHATLLVIHRLRYPLGRNDETALRLARKVLAGIERLLGMATTPALGGDCKHTERRGPQFDFRLTFPFFVAAVELRDPAERGVEMGKLGGIVCVELYQDVLGMMTKALTHIWGVRERNSRICWVDMISEAPFFVLF